MHVILGFIFFKFLGYLDFSSRFLFVEFRFHQTLVLSILAHKRDNITMKKKIVEIYELLIEHFKMQSPEKSYKRNSPKLFKIKNQFQRLNRPYHRKLPF